MDNNNEILPIKESRGARLMRKMAGQREDGDGGGSGSMGAGATLGGNAGLSQMGSIPNAGLAVVKGQEQTAHQCPTCHEWTDNDKGLCEHCGASLPSMRESVSSSFAERFNNYRHQRAGTLSTTRSQQSLNERTERQGTRGEICEEIAAHVVELVQRMSPGLLSQEDQRGEDELRERVHSMLEGFAGWKTRRTRS